MQPKDSVVQIVISGESGRIPAEIQYRDTLRITDHSIDYECNPYVPWKLNPNQKWSFKTNSIAFKKLFELAVEAVLEIFNRNIHSCFTDVNMHDFKIIYESGKTIENRYFILDDEFSDCFRIIKKMIPGCELVPGVLWTSEDHGKSELWEEIVKEYELEGISFYEANTMCDAIWDLLVKGKSAVRCPRCGNELEATATENFESITVSCKTKGCLSMTRNN